MSVSTPVQDVDVLLEEWDEAKTAAESAQRERHFLCFKESRKYSFLSPRSDLRGLWTAFLVTAIAYNAFTLPMRSTFPLTDSKEVWYCIDYVMDMVYIADVAWRFYVGFHSLGVIVTTRKLVIRNYLRSSFAIDILSVLPGDLAHFRDPQVHAFLRLNRLLRLWHLPAIFRAREDVSKRVALIRLTKLSLGVALLIHWSTCSFYAVLKQENRINKGVWPQNDDYEWSIGNWRRLNDRVYLSYSWCAFWCMQGLTGMGPNQLVPRSLIEVYFSMGMLFLGVFVFASVIGAATDTISNANMTSSNFKEKLDIINIWMAHKGIHAVVQNRIRNYYRYIWHRQAGLNDALILADMPLHLRTAVYSDLNRDILRRVQLFEKCTDDMFLQALTFRLKPEVYTPQDYIIRESDFGASMYFITRGVVDVYVSGAGKVNSLGENSFFGEVALLMKVRRNASIVARTYVDVFVLTKQDVDEVLVDFPDYEKLIYQLAIKMAVETNKEVAAPSAGMADEPDTGSGGTGAVRTKAVLRPTIVPTSPEATEVFQIVSSLEAEAPSVLPDMDGPMRADVQRAVYSLMIECVRQKAKAKAAAESKPFGGISKTRTITSTPASMQAAATISARRGPESLKH